MRRRPGTSWSLAMPVSAGQDDILRDGRARPTHSRIPVTEWWCAQSYANQSPCYLANIRVIFENNSVPAAKSVKKTCSTGISLILRQFDIREEQGAPNCRNTERAFDELGGGKRTHSDQESDTEAEPLSRHDIQRAGLQVAEPIE